MSDVSAFETTEHVSEPATERIKQISRRGFLGAVTALAAGSLADRVFSQSAAPLEQTQDLRAEIRLIYNELSVSLDQEGIPTRLSLGPAAEQNVIFSEEYKTFFRRRKLDAAQNNEILPIYQIRNYEPPKLSPGSIEQPYVSEAPSDILSSAELAAKGVLIWNVPFDDQASTLFLRSSIFSDNGILEPLSVLQESTSNNKVTLQIEVLNSKFSWPEYTSVDPTTDQIIDNAWLQGNIGRLRATKALEYQRKIDELEQKREEVGRTTEQYQHIQQNLFQLKSTQLLYTNTFTDAELLPHMLLPDNPASLGSYYSAESLSQSTEMSNTAAVLVAVPELLQTLDTQFFTLGFQPDGRLQVVVEDRRNERTSLTARIDGSYPNPHDIQPRPEEEAYLYYANSIGFVMYHEIAHFLLVDVFPRLATNGLLPKSQVFQLLKQDAVVADMFERLQVTDTTFPPIYEEKIADRMAKLFIEQAHAKWEKSGYTDNSGYAFVFKIPSDRFQTGGYQITGQLLPPTA